MLTTIDALNILNLGPDTPSYKKIEAAYMKMIQRYPPEVFPQKATNIRKAYDTLILSDEHIYELLINEDKDLSFLTPYFKNEY